MDRCGTDSRSPSPAEVLQVSLLCGVFADKHSFSCQWRWSRSGPRGPGNSGTALRLIPPVAWIGNISSHLLKRIGHPQLSTLIMLTHLTSIWVILSSSKLCLNLKSVSKSRTNITFNYIHLNITFLYSNHQKKTLYLFCWTQRKIKWRIMKKMLWKKMTSIIFFYTMDVNVFPTFFRISSFF